MSAIKGKPAHNKDKKLSLERKIENRIYRNVIAMSHSRNWRSTKDGIVSINIPDFIVRDIINTAIETYRQELCNKSH